MKLAPKVSLTPFMFADTIRRYTWSSFFLSGESLTDAYHRNPSRRLPVFLPRQVRHHDELHSITRRSRAEMVRMLSLLGLAHINFLSSEIFSSPIQILLRARLAAVVVVVVV